MKSHWHLAALAAVASPFPTWSPEEPLRDALKKCCEIQETLRHQIEENAKRLMTQGISKNVEEEYKEALRFHCRQGDSLFAEAYRLKYQSSKERRRNEEHLRRIIYNDMLADALLMKAHWEAMMKAYEGFNNTTSVGRCDTHTITNANILSDNSCASGATQGPGKRPGLRDSFAGKETRSENPQGEEGGNCKTSVWGVIRWLIWWFEQCGREICGVICMCNIH
eukprot:Blabericola_migrator_1__6933@NODE_3511_length_1718_cov_18_033919_g2180_i0_p1_GENE_NODE_3511_length_1718_cov_18_033919_g2180_i0NODE_3511_length_1718_cov_18_033919_g2180_i0_p1_ORF_typecomplete_len223_score40_26aGPTPplase1/PF18723_1/0_0035DUF2956/PF11169_8/0_097_NODE_3511_length_1718_cov_18_033919_g2180_i09201588